MNIPSSKVVFQDKVSPLKDFRYPEVQVAGVGEGPTPQQTIVDQIVEFRDGPTQFNQDIGFPTELAVDTQVRRKKGTSTFVDSFIVFEPAEGAAYHEFRVSKIDPPDEGDGE